MIFDQQYSTLDKYFDVILFRTNSERTESHQSVTTANPMNVIRHISFYDFFTREL